ncbi:MAG: helix-turn-helix domain-containing protein [Spirochaetaceae bacterium]|jgi:transcriptional regulator with XRE-family HTH domain|nr:helix-turn-helix domain-containing protein [Spirochaetaceae bacterium]
MEQGVNERIKAVRQGLGLSQRAFAKEIYISQSFYGAIELGQKEPNNRIIQLIATRFNVNKDWLITGKSEMFEKSPPDVKLEQLVAIFKQLNGLFQDYILLQINALLKVQNKSEESNQTLSRE